MLVVLMGLPGTGKSEVAHALGGERHLVLDAAAPLAANLAAALAFTRE